MAAFGAGWKPALLTSEPETEALHPLHLWFARRVAGHSGALVCDTLFWRREKAEHSAAEPHPKVH
jgi:hypothetical protein